MSAHSLSENETVYWTHPRLHRRFQARVIVVSPCRRYVKIHLEEAIGHTLDACLSDYTLDAIAREEGQEWAVGVGEVGRWM